MMFAFSFTASTTNETCSGNGTITFSSTNTDPIGSIVYIVYKLPNITTPYTVVNTNIVYGLSAATYRIIAKETVGNISTQKQLDVVINDAKTSLLYSIQSLNQACSNTSNISVNVISGTAQSYEIFAGPMIFPTQSSNTFNGLTVGVYKIRVFDNCGTGIVQTFTVNQNTAGISIGSPTFSNTSPPSCNFTQATNTLTPAPGTVLGYPLVVTYSIHPPGGGTTITQVVNLLNGNPTSLNLIETIPDYVNQNFDYDLTIVDACHSTYTQNFPVIKNISLTSSIINLECDHNYFSLQVANYSPPYTINFTSFPTTFNPSSYIVNYQGPYNQDSIQFGDGTTFTPFGDYSVTVLDSCGRTATSNFSIISQLPQPSINTSNNGCLTNSGTIVISIPNYPITNALVTSAPAGFGQTLPFDASSFIDSSGILTLNPVPIGDYIIQISNKCNVPIPPINCTIPIYVNQGLSSSSRPGCDLQKTSISISSKNSKLTSVLITSAPVSYNHPYPYDVSSNIIANGNLYLDNLPGGTYQFSTIDQCGFTNTITVTAAGYNITNSTFSLQPNCGSFNIPLNFISNGTTGQSFWLQKLINSATNTWGSPDYPSNGSIYVDGTVPNATNSLALINNTINYNLSYNGIFRIIRRFTSYNSGFNYNNGTVPNINKDCLEILSPTLDFHQALEITNVSRISCTPTGTLDVVITANGSAPLIYTILTKNGVPFVINNGSSNIFYNLAAGIYTYHVQDSCGNISPTGTINVATLPKLINITKPDDLLQCKTIITGNEIFDLTQQSSTILSSQSPSDYTLTYYTSMTDAMLGINSITNASSFKPTSNPQTIYARLIFNGLPNCYEITSFDLIVGQKPFVNLQQNYLDCSNIGVTLDATSNNLPSTTYSWTNAITSTNPKVTITQPGVNNIHVVATNIYGTQFCNTPKDITVTLSEVPKIDHFDVVDWTENENSITVYTSNTGDFEYSLDEINYQDSNVFPNLVPGLYTVYVRDKNGCGITQQMIWILYYKRYFTPNGDGINDTWGIDYSKFEPNLKVVIYDRFGKAITSLSSNNPEWDGNYNGQLLFATDYWFVVYRQDGRIHKGHFALKR